MHPLIFTDPQALSSRPTEFQPATTRNQPEKKKKKKKKKRPAQLKVGLI